jgi:hypothetical protein
MMRMMDELDAEEYPAKEENSLRKEEEEIESSPFDAHDKKNMVEKSKWYKNWAKEHYDTNPHSSTITKGFNEF